MFVNHVLFFTLFDGQVLGHADNVEARQLGRLLDTAKALCQTGLYGSPAFLADPYVYTQPSANACRFGLVAAHQENKLVGVALFRIVFDECEIEHVTVEESQRRLGVGAGLLSRLEQLAQNQGVKKIFLEVGVKNIGAQKLYAKFAFLPIATRPLYYRNSEDAVVMEKQL